MPTQTTATITWSTGTVPASSQVAYGTTIPYSNLSELDPTRTTAHSVTLVGLTPGTGYFYRVISRNAAGIDGTGTNDGAFTTLGTVSTGTFTITWDTIGMPSSSQVEYGSSGGTGGTFGSATFGTSTFGGSQAYDNITPLDPARVINHSVTLSGLAANTIYHYRAMSRNAAGILTVSGDQTFTTAVTAASAMQVMVIS